MRPSWWTLGIVCVGTFMLLLDVTIVNVALPDIQRELGASFADVQWVVDAYALLLAALLLSAGSLADRVGRRRVFVGGLVLFTIASALCGLAGSPTTLNLARALQGVGAAGVFATSLALLAATYQGAARGTAFGVWGAVTGAAVAIGPLVGGVLTEGLGWEWIFFVNVPIGLAAVLFALRRVPESRGPAGARLDVAGTLVFTAALGCLVFALIRGNAEGWGSPLILALLAAAVAGLVAFVVVERRSAEPMLDLGLLRVPTFVGASIAAFALSAGMFAMFLYLTFHVQNTLRYGPLDAGVRFLPSTLLAFFVAPVAGKLAARLPIRAFLGGGLLLIAAGLVAMRLGTDPGDDWTALLPGFVLTGAGIGLVNPPLATAAVGVVHPSRSGMASGINSTFRQVGIATGIAALGAIFARVVDGGAERFAAAAGPAGARVAEGGEFADVISFGLYHRLGPAAARAGEVAFLDGLHAILLVGAAVALIGAVLSFLLVRGSDFVAQGGTGPAAPERDRGPAGARRAPGPALAAD
jgi:EmrB/QacA subfamily drug resistance transporter